MAQRRYRERVNPLVDNVMDHIVKGIDQAEIQDEHGRKGVIKQYLRRGQDILCTIVWEDGTMDQVRITSSHY